MTDLHYAYVGHFVHDGRFAEITLDPKTRLARPRIREELNRERVDHLASEFCSDAKRREDWRMWWKDGMLIVDQMNDPLAIEFVRLLMRCLGCDVVEK